MAVQAIERCVLKTVADSLSEIHNHDTLAFCSFDIPSPDQFGIRAFADGAEEFEDDMAVVLVRLVRSIAFQRLRRSAWLLLGPSQRSIFFSKPASNRAAEEIRIFVSDRQVPGSHSV